MTSRDRIHWANAALMLLSCALAFVFPIELLVAAYAVLGPAHYLTEILWLRERGYYTTGARDYLWLAALSVPVYVLSRSSPSPLIWLALGSAAALAFLERPSAKAAVVAAVGALVFLAARAGRVSFFWTVMLPTLVHVYLFTGLFILAGALKEKSRPGLFSLAVFLVCGAAFFVWQPHGDRYLISESLRPKMQYFMTIDGVLLARLGLSGFSKTLTVMGFMGYAYTYHYLNWFSKVELIRWHEVGPSKLAAAGCVYALLLGLFAYDYGAGFAASTYLSLLHVVLEFPLDWRAAASIVRPGN